MKKLVITKKATETELYQDKVTKLLETHGIQAQNISLYILAFIHRSIVNERNDFTPEHNERLEFLGDAVLELAITEKLYQEYPEKQE